MYYRLASNLLLDLGPSAFIPQCCVGTIGAWVILYVFVGMGVPVHCTCVEVSGQALMFLSLLPFFVGDKNLSLTWNFASQARVGGLQASRIISASYLSHCWV